jgi:hypothetical protein
VDEEMLKMFTPQLATINETLFEVLLDLFLVDEEAHRRQNAQLANIAASQSDSLPTFVDGLILQLSVKIST